MKKIPLIILIVAAISFMNTPIKAETNSQETRTVSLYAGGNTNYSIRIPHQVSVVNGNAICSIETKGETETGSIHVDVPDSIVLVNENTSNTYGISLSDISKKTGKGKLSITSDSSDAVTINIPFVIYAGDE